MTPLAILLLGGGVFTVYAGITGQPIIPALRAILSGNKPGHAAADHTGQGIGYGAGGLLLPPALGVPNGLPADVPGSVPAPIIAPDGPVGGPAPSRVQPRAIPVTPHGSPTDPYGTGAFYGGMAG